MSSARSLGGLPACGFMVSATKGGQIPIAIEKRAKGKKVTVISNVQGNARALCTALTTLLGVGGTLHERGAKLADVEVQGEQTERVSAALRQLGCLRGMPRSRETAEAVVQRDCAYDDLLERRNERKPRHAQPTVQVQPPPLDAPCRKWHGDWMYCIGSCVLTDMSDIWSEIDSPKQLRRHAGSRARSSDQLDDLLQSLGMLAAPGSAVLEWHAGMRLLEEESARKRSAPQASLCSAPSKAATEGHYSCKECGAVFSLMRTLKRHEQMHKEERLCEKQSLVAPSAVEASSWRRATDEESAAYGANEEWQYADWDANGYDYSDDVDADLERYQAPRASTSLSSWFTVAVDRQGQKKPREQKPRAPVQSRSVKCPICDGEFLESEINQHIDNCLASPQQNHTQPAADDSCLTQELLQSLLELDLSDDAAERFWDHYERKLVSGSMQQDAFLAALELALCEETGKDSIKQPDIVCVDPIEVIEEEEEELEDEPWQEVKMNKKQGADSIKMKSGRGRRWTPLASTPGLATSTSSASNIRATTSTSSVSNIKTTTQGALPKACEPARPESSSTQAAKAKPSKVVAKPKPAPPKQSRTATAEVAEQRVDAWLEQALLQFMERDAVEAIIAGVQVVLDCSDDADAASNAVDLLADELPPGSVLGEEVLQEFKQRVARRR